jgi:hypothetical protein
MKWQQISIFFMVYVALVLFHSACSISTVSPEIAGIDTDFYPLQIGRFSEYEVSETKYTFVDGTISRNFQLRELISDTLRLQDNTLAYRLERSSRLDSTQEWQVDSIYVAYRDGNNLIRVESSIPYLKLVYPLRVNNTWNGNLFNNNNGNTPEKYKLSSLINDSLVLGRKTRVIKIIQRSDSNCRTNTYSLETYAENIGLIERIYKSYGYKESDPPCTGRAIIEVGKDYRERIVKVGN